MSKLFNVKGYWKKFDLPDFNDNDVWEGQILLEDDGWFEGIVIDRSNQELDRFIFGVYGPEKGIELYKLVP